MTVNMLVPRSTHQRYVDEFMVKAGQDVPQSPCIPDEKTRVLRGKLILEECLETISALGLSVAATAEDGHRGKYIVRIDSMKNVEIYPEGKCDIVEVVDGCCDIAVVATGTLSAFGVGDVGPQREVDESNLRKFGPGGHRREDGKWMKPRDWKAPDLLAVLKSQGYDPDAEITT